MLLLGFVGCGLLGVCSSRFTGQGHMKGCLYRQKRCVCWILGLKVAVKFERLG